MQFNNGIPADRLVSAAWRKSRVSNPSGNCVEVAELPGDAIAGPQFLALFGIGADIQAGRVTF